jgi:nucleotide-binding universal stress UspA family protein
MQPVWKILAPVELHERAAIAVEGAAEVAHALGAQLVLAHVAERGFYETGGNAGWPRPVEPVRRILLSGDPAGAICRFADVMDAEMVFLAPRVRRGWSLLRRRSVSAAVLDGARRPVLLWRPGGGRFQLRTVLCALRLDGTDRPLLDRAMALAARSGAEVAYVHALPEISEGLLTSGLGEPDRPLSKPVAVDRLRELGVAYSTTILSGSTAGCIAQAARQTCADLVVVGRDAGGVDARDLLRKLSCPVVSVPVGALARRIGVAGHEAALRGSVEIAQTG